jgi:hypothetical protein
MSVKFHYDPTLQHIRVSDFDVCLLLFTEGEYFARYVTLVTTYYIISCEQTRYLD